MLVNFLSNRGSAMTVSKMRRNRCKRSHFLDLEHFVRLPPSLCQDNRKRPSIVARFYDIVAADNRISAVVNTFG